jgi:hypothetical protein
MQEVKFKQHRPDSKVFRRWNRDMATCLNFIQIIQSFHVEKGVPKQFYRNTIAATKRPKKRQEDSERRRVRRRQQ